MKRFMLLAVALVMVLGMAVSASAVEVTTSGNLLVNAVWQDNWDFANKGTNDNNNQTFTVYERADLYFTATANENLKGVLGLRSQRAQWGQDDFANDTAGGASATGAQLNIRDAYIDFNYPGTSVNVKAGLYPVSLPAMVGGGSMVQNARAGAAFVSTAFTDNVSMLAGWARLNNNVAAGSGNRGELDAWVLALPMTFEGVTFVPFGAFAPLGKNMTYADVATAGYTGLASVNGTTTRKMKDAYWLGAAFSMDMFDPFVLKADFNYGKVSADNSDAERSGWLFDAAVEYKGFDFMTPELYYVYTTGEDGNGSKGNGSSERMPVLKGDWAVGSFFFGGDSITGGSLDSNADQNGFWALGLALKDIQSFAEGLTHDVHVLYAKGTNDKDSFNMTGTGGNQGGAVYGRTLTEKDSMTEISATTAYKIYDELTAYVDLGYVNLNAKESVWNTNNKGGDAWKFTTGVVYLF